MIVAADPSVLLRFLDAPSHLIPILVKSHDAPQIGKYCCICVILLMNSRLNCSRKAALHEAAP